MSQVPKFLSKSVAGKHAPAFGRAAEGSRSPEWAT